MVYTTFEICKNLDIRLERFRMWIDNGYVEPSIQKASGRGTKNLFSKDDLYLVGLFKHLIECGFSREESSKKVESVRHVLQNIDVNPAYIGIARRAEGTKMPYRDGKLVYPDCIIWPEKEEIQFDDIGKSLPDFDDFLIINFGKIRQKVDSCFQ